MQQQNQQYVERPLEKVPVYQAQQAKTMQFYVPLPVFAVEAIALLAFFRFFGFWTFLFVPPLHVLLVIKTSSDPWWVENLLANFKYRSRMLVSNSGLRGKRVVTFVPRMTRRELMAEMKSAKPRRQNAKRTG